MLKDITLGQYFPGSSIIHRMDPRIKLILLFCFITALLMANHALTYAGVLLFLALAVAVSRIKPKALFKGMRPMLFIVIFTAVLNIFYTPGEPLVSFWVFNIAAEGIERAVFMALRLTMLISATFMLTYTTSPIFLSDALARLMSPLAKLKIPVHEFAMMMTIALRFIPTIIEETDKIMSAQKARGADFETGNLFRRAKALIPLLVPLFVGAFRRADDLAVAMECRCYHGGEGRTRMKQLHMTAEDAAVLTGGLLLLSGLTVLGRLGWFIP
ncbi:MAG: energy-coupling factor transporter transmembrane protein EcfT [Oscillospiraceae bacterium]|jgi:energy-coupling factor transport system permease protein|nr:energy-coupling factor transporter transmembrane protein EcfT [Oscillospiraceae bacterium]